MGRRGTALLGALALLVALPAAAAGPEALVVQPFAKNLPLKTVFASKTKYDLILSGTVTLTTANGVQGYDPLFSGPGGACLPGSARTTVVAIIDSRNVTYSPQGAVACRGDHTYTFTLNSNPTAPDLVGAAKVSTTLNPSAGATASGSFVVQLQPVGSGGGSAGGGSTTATAGSAVQEAKFQHGGTGAWVPLRKRQDVEPGDRVHTGFTSGASLRLGNGGTVRFAPLAMIQLTKIGLALRQGEIDVDSGSSSESFRIVAPTAAVSTSGGVFSVIYDPPTQTTVVYLKSGSVDVEPVNPRFLHPVLKPGQEVELTPKGVSPTGHFDQAGTPKGVIGRRAATALVLATLRQSSAKCGLDESAPTSLVSLAHYPGGWEVSAKLVGRKTGGWGVWSIFEKKLTPLNLVAKDILQGCPK